MDNTYKLLIIGNGFDLQHKLKTSFRDFLKFLKNKCDIPTHGKGPHEIIGNLFYCGNNVLLSVIIYHWFNEWNEKKDIEWNDVEKWIGDLINNTDKEFDILWTLIKDSYELYNPSIANENNSHSKYWYKDLMINDWKKMEKTFSKYLKKEVENYKKDDFINDEKNKCINENTIIINFNFTNVIKKYIPDYINIFNIHGDISQCILGSNEINYNSQFKEINKKIQLNDKNINLDEKILNNFAQYNYRSILLEIIIYGHSINKQDLYVYDWIFEEFINFYKRRLFSLMKEQEPYPPISYDDEKFKKLFNVKWKIYFKGKKDKINKISNLLSYKEKTFNMKTNVKYIDVDNNEN